MNVVVGVEAMGVGVIMTPALVVVSEFSMVEVFLPRQTSTPAAVPSIGQSSLSAIPADSNLLIGGLAAAAA